MDMAIEYLYVDSHKGERRRRIAFKQNRIKIGRANDCDLLLGFDLDVSAEHAEMFYHLSTWYIRDMGSRYGTKVNNHLIEGTQPLRLHPDCIIKIGKTTLRVKFEEMQDILDDPVMKGSERVQPVETPVNLSAKENEVVFEAFQMQQNIQKWLNMVQGQQLLKLILQEIRDAFKTWSHFSLVLVEGDEQQLVPREFIPTDHALVSMELVRRTIASQEVRLWQRQAIEGQAITLDNMFAAIYAPLMFAGRAIGAIHIGTDQPYNRATDRDMELMRSLSLHLGPIVYASTQVGMEYFPSAFISYKRESRDFVTQLEKDLRKRRVRPWFDANLRVGETSWEEKLDIMIRETDVFILVMTPEAVTSPYVLWEMNKALHYKRPIFPLMIEECTPPPALTQVQFARIDADNPTAYPLELDKLVSQVKKIGIRG